MASSKKHRRESRRTDIPALGQDYAEEEEGEENTGAYPSVGGVGGNFVKVALVYLLKKSNQSVSRTSPAAHAEPHDALTLPSFVVCALTAAKGVSGSG